MEHEIFFVFYSTRFLLQEIYLFSIESKNFYDIRTKIDSFTFKKNKCLHITKYHRFK